MTLDLANPPQQRSRFGKVVDMTFTLFIRSLAIIFFAGALYTWARLVGFWPGDDNRFDTMSQTLKVYSIVLAVVLPVASVGMWTMLQWGRVIWFLLIGFQTVMAIRFFDMMEHAAVIIIFHALTLGCYVIFQGLLFFINKKA